MPLITTPTEVFVIERYSDNIVSRTVVSETDKSVLWQTKNYTTREFKNVHFPLFYPTFEAAQNALIARLSEGLASRRKDVVLMEARLLAARAARLFTHPNNSTDL